MVASQTIELMTSRESSSVERNPFGRLLGLWMVLVVLIQIACWLSGTRGAALAVAVERGAARVERWSIGEVGDDVIRKAIQTQHDSLPFWATLAAIGDFVVEPLSLAVRAVLVTILFCGLAALTGRTVQFDSMLGYCAAVQGIWVLGLAVRLGLILALGREEAETSATLFLPAGTTHSALTWVGLRQLDVFALAGWSALAWGGWKRKQVSVFSAVVLCGLLWAFEAFLRISGSLSLGAGMRMTLIPS